MKLVTGDLWSHPCPVKCITTNGDVTPQGRAITGAGCALEAQHLFGQKLRQELGWLISTLGNRVHILGPRLAPSGWLLLVSFPTKHHWHDLASIDLIIQSAYDLYTMADTFGWDQVLLPRPGCGFGGLDWALVETYLRVPLAGDRFLILSREGE